MRSVTLRLPEDLDRVLSELVGRLHLTRSAVIRLAIEADARARIGSVGDRAADLAGILDGPRDLSTSNDHRAGYGG